jgi:hypothetical protein
LDGVIIRIEDNSDPELQSVRFANASFRDYLTGHLSKNSGMVEPIIDCAAFFEQYSTLAEWAWPSTRFNSFSGTDSIRSMLIPHADSLVRRMLELIDAPPADPIMRLRRFRTIGHRNGRATPDLYTQRFLEVCRIIKAVYKYLQINFLSPQLRIVVERWREPNFWKELESQERGRGQEGVDLLMSTPLRESTEVREMHAAILRGLEGSSTAPRDYISRAELMDLVKLDREDLRGEAEEFIRSLAADLLTMDVYEQIDNERDELIEAARYFDIDIDIELSLIDEHIKRLPSEDEDNSDWPSSSRSEPTYEVEIDQLFDTLRE